MIYDKGEDRIGIMKPLSERRSYVIEQIKNFDKDIVEKDLKKFPLYSSKWIKDDLSRLWLNK